MYRTHFAPAPVKRRTPLLIAADLALLATQDPEAFRAVLGELAEALADARRLEGAGPFARAKRRPRALPAAAPVLS